MINLHNFTFSLAPRVARRTTARGLLIWFVFPMHVTWYYSNFLLLHTYDVFKEKEQIPLKNHMNYNGEQYKCLKDPLLKDDCTAVDDWTFTLAWSVLLSLFNTIVSYNYKVLIIPCNVICLCGLFRFTCARLVHTWWITKFCWPWQRMQRNRTSFNRWSYSTG